MTLAHVLAVAAGAIAARYVVVAHRPGGQASTPVPGARGTGGSAGSPAPSASIAVVTPPPPAVSPPSVAPPPPSAGPSAARPADAAGYVDYPARTKVDTYTVELVGDQLLITRRKPAQTAARLLEWTAAPRLVGQPAPKPKAPPSTLELVRILTGAWSGLWVAPDAAWHAA